MQEPAGALVSVSLACHASAAPRAAELRDGDLVFQISRSAQSAAVALATRSSLTHMRVVFVDGGDMALAHPKVQRKLLERFGRGDFSPDEPIITPQAMFEDPRLELVGGP